MKNIFNRALILLILACLIPLSNCFAGETTLTGTATCFMPQLLEFNTQSQEIVKSAVPQPPTVSGASGKYEVQEEERLIANEENINTDEGEKTTVYTVCAK